MPVLFVKVVPLSSGYTGTTRFSFRRPLGVGLYGLGPIKMEEDTQYQKNQDNYNKGLRDQYNTLQEYEAMEDYQRIIKQGNSNYMIREKEQLKDYLIRLETHIEYLAKINYKTHIDAPRGCWYTHKRPECFMCNDRNMHFYLLNLMKTLSKYIGDYTPRP